MSDDVQILNDSPQLPAKLPQAFTSENARLMAARSWEVRRQRAAERAAQPQEAQPVPQPSETLNDYVSQQLMRVREHLERVDGLLADSTDAQEIERLSRARATLAETERVLDGRPLPGSRRPGKERPAEVPEVEPL